MDKRIVSVKELLSYFPESAIECQDYVIKGEAAVYGIGNAFIPDHRVECAVPRDQRHRLGCDVMQVELHILWLENDNSQMYAGLVADKADREVYFAQVYPGDADSAGSCSFRPATRQEIREKAKTHNIYLQDIAQVAFTDKVHLLEQQLYSPFTDRFYYLEMPCDDRVRLCSVGLNDNRFWSVGWLGKLINKDLFATYAECSPVVYAQLKQQYPSAYRRAQLMERNKHLFSCYHTLCGKSKQYPELLDAVKNRKTDTQMQRNVLVLAAAPKGISMREYVGPAYSWMEEMLSQCRRNCREP